MQFYSVKLKKKIEIPKSKVTYKKKSNRHFAVGTYKIDGKEYKAWKIVSKDKVKK